MRRSLVLTDEIARHPFRAGLPPQVRALSLDDIDNRRPWREQLVVDARGFAQAYFACFLAVAVFIS
ncbi:MAG: hypothetical protein ABIT16_13525 [Croceibacterium sp.]